MELLGARLEIVKSDDGRMTEKLTRDMIAAAAVHAERRNCHWTDQLSNTDQIEAYRKIGEEIWNQTGAQIDAFIQSVCTAGSIRGVGESLRRHDPTVRLVAVEPEESPVLSGGPTGAHGIDGVGANVVAALRVAQTLEPGATIVTLMCDTGMKYPSTDLFRRRGKGSG